MATESQYHSALPWNVPATGTLSGYYVYTEAGHFVANCGGRFRNLQQDTERKANAHFIAQACNAHEGLLAVCATIAEWPHKDGECAIVDQARAAIAKATTPQGQ